MISNSPFFKLLKIHVFTTWLAICKKRNLYQWEHESNLNISAIYLLVNDKKKTKMFPMYKEMSYHVAGDLLFDCKYINPVQIGKRSKTFNYKNCLMQLQYQKYLILASSLFLVTMSLNIFQIGNETIC